MKEKPIFYLKKFAFPLFVFGLIILLSVFLLLPKIGQIFIIRDKIKKQEAEIVKLAAKIADLSSLSEAELIGNSELLSAALPFDNDIFTFLAVVKKTLIDSNLTLEDFDVSPGVISSESALPASGVGVPSVSMAISLSGTFENIRKFLEKTEKYLPIIRSESIEIASLPNSSSSAELIDKSEMKLVFFYQPLRKKLTDFDAPLPKVSAAEQKLIEELRTYERYLPEEAEAGQPVLVGRESLF